MNPQPPIPPPNPPYNPYPQNGNMGGYSSEERNWAVAAHLSAFLSYVLTILTLVVPLGIWLMKKDESIFISTQAKEALNFQISLWIWMIVAFVMFLTVILIPVAIVIFVVGCVASIICPIMGAIKVANGEHYRYPFTIRLVS